MFTKRFHFVVIAIIILCLYVFLPSANAAFQSVKNFGAIGDGKSIDTQAIQKAIDTANKNGGGTVFFPSGTYLSGTIFLKSHVSLYFDAGFVLLGSTKDEDYPETICEYRSYTDNYTVKSLIYAEKVENVSILGRGTLDGQGAAFKERRSKENPYKLRPYMIRMIECQDVTVRDVTIVNSPMWVQHYLACEDVLIDGITVNSFVAGNNDGIDIDSCDKVRNSNCEIYSGDDAIVLKATSDRPCKNVTVTNCVLSTHCNAFKLGTESNGGFENITFSNSTIFETRLAGIALEMVDGGLLERVTITNIAMDGVGTAIFLRLGNRARPYNSQGPGGGRGTWIKKEGLARPGMGFFRKVVISNVQAINVGDTGCSITGLPGHTIEDVVLENVRIDFKGGGTADLVDREIPENEEKYPEHSMFGKLPSYGFFVRHANDIRFENVETTFDKSDKRPAFKFVDVDYLNLVDVDGEIETGTMAFVVLDDVQNALISGCLPTRPMGLFMFANNSSNISLSNNNFVNVKKIAQTGEGMDSQDISTNESNKK
jgi:polygalacturonase